MCELLGMSANVPTDICFSFCGLLERGGRTGPHRDGWGITFYEGKGCRSFKDPLPSCDSEIAKLVRSYPIKSCSVISHIRQANRGKVSLENTHPFIREMWGRHWTYAHNGQLSNYKDKLKSDFFQPVGNTDSEMAFCWIMDNIKKKYPNRPKDMKPVFRYVAKLAASLKDLGVFNMLLSDGIYLMTYCTSKLHWITRRAPFGKATLIDTDWVIDFQQETTPNDVVSVIATEPLTGDETWQKMESGEFILFKKGELILKGGIWSHWFCHQ